MKFHWSLILLWTSLTFLMNCVSSKKMKFDCPSLPPLAKPATSVHELRPQDIKVVMAMGDSITAGFGAMGWQLNPLKTLYEYRGISWSIGGDPNAVTIANFLRHYNPNIVGASVGTQWVEVCYGRICYWPKYNPEHDVLNAALSGATFLNLKNREVNYLVDQLHKMPSVDVKNDWKLLTILAGFNDICLECLDHISFLNAGDLESNLRDALEQVRKNIPRVFVNVVQMFNFSLVYELSRNSKYCKTFHALLPVECICFFDPTKNGHKLRENADNLVAEYNEKIRKVAEEYGQMKYNDFAVVVQPGLKDATSDMLPFDILSTLDCFHPSLKGHQAFAKAIWNNMLTPAANKSTKFDFKSPFICPNENTLLYTY